MVTILWLIWVFFSDLSDPCQVEHKLPVYASGFIPKLFHPSQNPVNQNILLVSTYNVTKTNGQNKNVAIMAKIFSEDQSLINNKEKVRVVRVEF